MTSLHNAKVKTDNLNTRMGLEAFESSRSPSVLHHLNNFNGLRIQTKQECFTIL